MKQSKAIMLTQSLLREYYEYGSIVGIAQLLTEDAIAFGIESETYAVGTAAVERMLETQYQVLMPCHIDKMGSTETLDEENLHTTVCSHLVFRTERQLANMHCIRFMYRIEQRGRLRLSGIIFQRDMQREHLFRHVSRTLLNQLDDAKGEARGMLSMFASYVECGAIVYESDGAQPFAFCADRIWQMLGYPTREAFLASGMASHSAFICESDKARVREEMEAQLRHQDGYKVEYRVRHSSGGCLWVLECGRYESREEGGVCSAMLINLAPLSRTHERFLYALQHDALTGLLNREAFCHKAEDLLFHAPDTAFEIMCFDIDRFKVINDLFGEETGNRLLRYIAYFLCHIELQDYVAGRLHTDNFILCYPARSDLRSHMLNSLRMLAGSFSLDYRVSFSIGVYRITDRSLSISSMCDRALIAMGQAQNNGLLEYGVYKEDMRDGLVNEQMIANHMQRALERGEFLIYLQPKYDLAHERIIGAEALVRWRHPQLGFISPSRFVPIFERNGFIYKLDKYIWELACKLLRRELDEGRRALPISINVSRVDLYSPDIVRVIESLVKKYALPPSLLELEITESAYVDNPQHIIDITRELQGKGFVILMDDFGSGYSSLNMLKNLSVDVLKIDMEFLAYNESVEQRARGSSILCSVVKMAKWLQLPVIAEGVETREQVEFLRSIDCECVQGYYFSKPVPVAKYEEMVEESYREESAVK